MVAPRCSHAHRRVCKDVKEGGCYTVSQRKRRLDFISMKSFIVTVTPV
jgi:hypothetical protein